MLGYQQYSRRKMRCGWYHSSKANLYSGRYTMKWVHRYWYWIMQALWWQWSGSNSAFMSCHPFSSNLYLRFCDNCNGHFHDIKYTIIVILYFTLISWYLAIFYASSSIPWPKCIIFSLSLSHFWNHCGSIFQCIR